MSSTVSAAGAIQRTNWWHEQIVDWELMNPDATMGECALHFGKTEPWLSRIRNSDAYNEFRDRRVAEHQDMVSSSVIEKTEELGKLSLDILNRRVREAQDDISLGFVKETAEMALKAMGYSRGPVAPGQQVNIMIGTADPEALARARDKLRLVQNNEQKRIDGDAHVVEGGVITAEAV